MAERDTERQRDSPRSPVDRPGKLSGYSIGALAGWDLDEVKEEGPVLSRS
jgi:hypothetical protein